MILTKIFKYKIIYNIIKKKIYQIIIYTKSFKRTFNKIYNQQIKIKTK